MHDEPLISCEPPLRPPQRVEPIAILASGNGSNFESICNAASKGDLHAEIRCVIFNNPGAGVAARAKARNIESHLIDHRRFEGRREFDQAVVAALQASGARWVVMAGWMRIATTELLHAFPDRVVNIHPSLLPSFRGLHAVQQALDAGVTLAGCTVHIVRPEVDSGPILGQAAVRVRPTDTVESLHRRIHAAEHILYPRALQRALTQSTAASS